MAEPNAGTRASLRLLAGSKHGAALPYLLLTLTFVTGLVDAVSVLELGRVFVANMTGNVVSIGFAIAGAPGFSLWGSALALAGFVAGATIGGGIVARVSVPRRTMLRNVLLIVVLFFIASTVIAWTTDDAAGPLAQNAIVVLTSFALGLQNAAVRHLAVPDLTTTVLTMTITGIAADIRSGDRIAVTRRAFAIVSMLLGATAGGFIVLHLGVTVALAVIVVVQLVVAAFLAFLPPDPGVPAAEGSRTAG
ncbi:YoaK family protein [Plantibacter sp. YIM 135347]|uniref:YoaK family protein n=1 Tax=Plantibacter sp. YIM 135347 TaxID=3423919 RepID=UPI003D343292